MTGYVVPVMRDGRRETCDIDELTDKEMLMFFSDHVDNDECQLVVQWACALAAWIRDNVKKGSVPEFHRPTRN